MGVACAAVAMHRHTTGWSPAVHTSNRGDEGVAAGALRVLIVEDEAISALLLEQTLHELGYDVCGVADSAPGAVEAAGAHRPDLILMDIRLAGGTDGVSAAEQVRDRYGIPSIFVTAYSDAATRQRAERARPVGFLWKPYSREQVSAALNEAVRRLGGEPD